MSNINLIIEERAANIGNFMVGRLLPFRKKRMVGPFVFIDHMGPVNLTASEQMDIGPHPHIGLSTLTFLFEGSIMHRDSLGTEMEIKPGAVNWMTAGKGIVHSERTPDYLRNQAKRIHGLQIWVALPKALENMEPSFHHVAKKDIPTWEKAGVHYKLIAGKALGKTSPLPVHSDLYFIEIKATQRQKIDLGQQLYGENALYILEGKIHSEENTYGEKQILVAKEGLCCSFEMDAGTTVYLFGGEIFPEERHIHWNFVATSKERIAEAREDWKNERFPKIEGETGYIPLPD